MIKTCLDAVKNHIAEKFPECTCRRAWAAESSRQYIGSIDTPLVSVVLADRGGKIIDRKTTEMRLAVYIVVQKKLKSGSADIEQLTAEVDPLVKIMERLFEAFLVPVTLEAGEAKILCRNPLHDVGAPIYHAGEIFKNLFLGLLQIDVEVQTTRQ